MRSGSGYSKFPSIYLAHPEQESELCVAIETSPLCRSIVLDRSAARNNEYYRKMRRFPWYYNISWRDRIGARVPGNHDSHLLFFSCLSWLSRSLVHRDILSSRNPRPTLLTFNAIPSEYFFSYCNVTVII